MEFIRKRTSKSSDRIIYLSGKQSPRKLITNRPSSGANVGELPLRPRHATAPVELRPTAQTQRAPHLPRNVDLVDRDVAAPQRKKRTMTTTPPRSMYRQHRSRLARTRTRRPLSEGSRRRNLMSRLCDLEAGNHAAVSREATRRSPQHLVE